MNNQSPLSNLEEILEYKPEFYKLNYTINKRRKIKFFASLTELSRFCEKKKFCVGPGKGLKTFNVFKNSQYIGTVSWDRAMGHFFYGTNETRFLRKKYGIPNNIDYFTALDYCLNLDDFRKEILIAKALNR